MYFSQRFWPGLLVGLMLLFTLSACGAAEGSVSESGGGGTEETPVAAATSTAPAATESTPLASSTPQSEATVAAENTSPPTNTVESLPTEAPTELPPTVLATAEPTEVPIETPPTPLPTAEPSKPAADLFEVVNVASDDVLNVRENPGVGNPIVGTIPPNGTGVEVIGASQQVEDGGFWLPVRYQGVTGWAHSYFLAPESEVSVLGDEDQDQDQDEGSQAVGDRAKEIVLALQNRDLATLANFVHPDKEVRFSPYTFVRLNATEFDPAHLIFSAAQINNLFADPTVYHWGTFDGSGAPINMTFAEYFERFVYDVDFANPDAIGYNDPIGQGNTINNIAEVYPEATVVEYYLEGTEEFGGLDWRSLRLVLEQKDGEWYLVGIVHAEWTI